MRPLYNSTMRSSCIPLATITNNISFCSLIKEFKPLIPDNFSRSDWVHDVLEPPKRPKKVTSLPLKLLKRSHTGMTLVRTPPSCTSTTYQHISTLSPTISSQLDTQMSGLISDLKILSKHLSDPNAKNFSFNRQSKEEVSQVVNDLHRLVEIPQKGVDVAREDMTANEIKTKEEREMFITLDGPTYLQRIIRPNLSTTDARKFSKGSITENARTYNDTLLLLRELCYINPELSDTFKTEFIVYLFTLLDHRDVFEVRLDKERSDNMNNIPYRLSSSNFLSWSLCSSLRSSHIPHIYITNNLLLVVSLIAAHDWPHRRNPFTPTSVQPLFRGRGARSLLPSSELFLQADGPLLPSPRPAGL